mmetsp:Transcript_5897/g.8908  ORF Transcript_5897/g.8908 Transcript_5897/m.8908 type:complete len:212 (-) Transcript_5897:46-681(-)
MALEQELEDIRSLMEPLLQQETGEIILISDLKAQISVHESILRVRAPKILEKMKRNKVKLHFKANAKVLQMLKEYLYLDKVAIEHLQNSFKDVIFLYNLGKMYHLNRLCYLILLSNENSMNSGNIHQRLKTTHEGKCQDLKNREMEYMLKNYNEFIACKDGIYITGIELFQECVASFQTGVKNIPLKDLEVPSTLGDDYARIVPQAKSARF